jgi:8-oxo-dGTP diphosphatase
MNLELLDKKDHEGAKGPVFIGSQKILVYWRDHNTDYLPGYLDFPGGGKNKGETVFETFHREIKEEFGLSIKKSDIKYVRQYPHTRFPGQLAYFVVAMLPNKAFREIKFGKEGTSYELMDVNDFINSRKAISFLKERTKDFLKLYEKA